MKLGKAFCVSGICLIGAALALAWFCTNARAVVSPSELDGICGGQCGVGCSERATPGCAQDYESGDCELQYAPGIGYYCPDETAWDSCNHDQEICTSGIYWHCEIQGNVPCGDWVWRYQCQNDNLPDPNCYWQQLQHYPCSIRDPNTYDKCWEGDW